MRPKDAGLPRVGILEFLTGLHPDRWDEPQLAVAEMLLAPRLIDEARERNTSNDESRMLGDLFFIPAGDLGEGVEHFIENVQRAELHNLKKFLVDLDQDPRMVFKVFRQQVEAAAIAWRGERQEGPPDYLLIDCRTGITEIGELLLGDATDFTVIVYGQGEQNLEGLRIVLNASPRRPGDLVANTMLIWSGAVAGQEELKVRQQHHKQQLIEQICRPDSLGLREPFPKEFVIPFNPDLVFSDVPLVHRVPEGELARLFEDITDYLEERCLWRDKIIESIVAPVDPQGRESEEQRRVKVAATSETKKEAHLQQAYLQLELSRGLTQLFFSPPPWNLAGVPTPEIVRNWPDGFSSIEQQNLFLQLLPYSMSLTAREKQNIVEQTNKISVFQMRELLRILSEERHKCLGLTPEHYWQLIGLTLNAGIEWLAMLAQPIRPQARSEEPTDSVQRSQGELSSQVVERLDRALLMLVEGEPIHGFAESEHPLFGLLIAQILRAAQDSQQPGKLKHEESVSTSTAVKPKIDRQVPYLTRWLSERKLNPIGLRVSLTRNACSAAEGRQLPNSVLGHCWERHAAALYDQGRAAEPAEKAGWFDRAIAA